MDLGGLTRVSPISSFFFYVCRPSSFVLIYTYTYTFSCRCVVSYHIMVHVAEFGALLYIVPSIDDSRELRRERIKYREDEDRCLLGAKEVVASSRRSCRSTRAADMKKAWFVIKCFHTWYVSRNRCQNRCGSGGESGGGKTDDHLSVLRHLQLVAPAWHAQKFMGCTYSREVDDEIGEAGAFLPNVWRTQAHAHTTR